MGIPVIEGRDFSKADELSDHVSYIFNRTAMEGLDMQVGDAFDSYSSGHLVGFSDDVKFTRFVVERIISLSWSETLVILCQSLISA